MPEVHPLVRLAHRFTLDWLDRADESVPPQIMVPGYRVHIGDVTLDGLQAYTPATAGQLRQFPGLQLSIHALVTDGEHLALHFTEHGASVRYDLRAAAWTGVALFAWDGERLTENWTQEDYAARRRQLAGGTTDVIAAPLAAPWTTVPVPGVQGAVDVVRAWLPSAVPGAGGTVWDDGLSAAVMLEPTGAEESLVFAAGNEVAFAATLVGAAAGKDARLGIAGLVRVVDGAVAGGVVVSDRAGLARSLR